MRGVLITCPLVHHAPPARFSRMWGGPDCSLTPFCQECFNLRPSEVGISCDWEVICLFSWLKNVVDSLWKIGTTSKMLSLYYFLLLLPLISFIFGFILFILLCHFFRNLFPCYFPLVFLFIPSTIFLFPLSLFSSFVATFLWLLFSISFSFSSCLLFVLSFAVIIQSTFLFAYLLFLTIFLMFCLYKIFSKYIYCTQT